MTVGGLVVSSHLAAKLADVHFALNVAESLKHPFAKLGADALVLRFIVGDRTTAFALQAVLLEGLYLDLELDHPAEFADGVVEYRTALAGGPFVGAAATIVVQLDRLDILLTARWLIARHLDHQVVAILTKLAQSAFHVRLKDA